MPTAVRPGFSANVIPASQGSIGPVSLGFAANFFGTSYDQLWINADNGDVTFNGALSALPFVLTSPSNSEAIIAPFLSAVDTSGPGSGLVTYGTGTVDGHAAFGVTWPNVGYSNQQTDKLNTFQVVLIAYPETGQGNFDIEFNYDQVQWDTAQITGSIQSIARVGFSSGTANPGTSFELAGSGVSGSFLDSNQTTGLIHGSLDSTVAGRYVFHVRSSTIAADSTAVSSSVDTSVYGQPVTFMASVTSAGSPVTTGTVTFQEGSTVLASAVPLDNSGHASLTVATLPAANSPHTITALYSGTTAFSPSSGNSTLTVNPAPLTVRANDASKVYGQDNPAFSTSYDGFVNGDTASSLGGTLVFNTPATAASPVGSYAVTPGGLTAANYAISFVSGALTITPAPLTLTAKDASKTYGQTLTFAGTEFTTNGLLNSDTVASVTLTGAGAAATATIAGSPYDIVPSAAVGTGLGNYTISYVNGKLTVNPAVLTVTAKDASKTYGQTLTFASTEFTASGLVNSDTVTSVTLTSSGAAATATVAGSPYDFVPSAAVGTGLSNYAISYVNGKLTVNPAALTITAKDASKTYGQTLTFTGSEFTTSGLLNSDGVTSVTLTSAGAAATATVAGSPYDIVPSAAVGTGLSNYAISYVNGKLTVNPAALTITAKDASKTYGQTLTFTGSEFTTSGLLNSDGVTSVTLTSAGAAATATVAGSPYDIVPSAAAGAGLGNYAISYVNGKLTVNPAALTITAKDTSKTYGQTLTFVGTEFTASGLLNSDTLTSVTLTSGGAAATAAVAGSPYDIVPSAAVGTGLGNYTISYVNGKLVVNPAALTILAKDTSKTYGQTLTFAGTEFTTSGLLNSDTVTLVTLSSAGAAATASAVGSPYDIVPSAAVGTGLGNYTISYVDGKLTVNPAALTITAKDGSKTYGQTLTFAGTEFTAGGLLNSDAVTSVMLTSAGAAATASVAGSPYDIVPSAAVGTGLNNYTINYVDGKLTVNPAALTITAKDGSKTYGQTLAFAGTEFTTSGLLSSDTVTSVTLSSGGAAATASVAGSPYDIVPSAAVGTGLGNYTISYVNGKLTINPAALTITAKDASKTYGKTVTFTGSEFTTGGLLNSDSVTSITLSSAGAAATASVAGSPYDIVPSAAVGSGLGNYTISYVDGKLTVSPAALTVTADNVTRIYGQVNPTFTVSYSGFVNGDTASSLSGTLTFNTSATPASPVGSYAITPGGLTASNYTITFVNGMLTITPAALTVTADNKTRLYGQANPAFTLSYSGFVNGDTASSLGGTLSLSTPATASSPVGSYAITPSGLTSNNYTISFVSGSLSVTKRTVSVAVSANPSTINAGQTASVTVTVTDTSGPAAVNIDPAGTISFSVSGSLMLSAPTATLAGNGSGVSTGQVTVTGVGSPGGTVTANFADDGIHSGGSNSTGLMVSSAPPTVGSITAPVEPQPIGTAITASATFTDPDTAATHTALWNWGDGTPASAGTVTELKGSGSVAGSHAYSTDGVFIITLTVTANGGRVATSTLPDMVIYNPNGGFVTGGGWITSPAGAYLANAALTGKATLGFNAKYKTNSTDPTGNTEFQFPAANLNFHATGYDWLVITSPQAQYQGSGTINGSGNFGFFVTALDGKQLGGGGLDRFRLKIWDKNNGNAVVYDTQPGAADTAAPTTALGGGNITVHLNGGAAPPPRSLGNGGNKESLTPHVADGLLGSALAGSGSSSTAGTPQLEVPAPPAAIPLTALREEAVNRWYLLAATLPRHEGAGSALSHWIDDLLAHALANQLTHDLIR